MSIVTCVDAAGTLEPFELSAAPEFSRPIGPLRSRIAYAAAHVVPRTVAENVPGAPADIDWDATLAFRRHVWSWGLGVADAMDTAQRNMGLDAKATRELIARSAAEAQAVGGALVVGVNTDHVLDEVVTLADVIDAYVEQLHFAEDHGAEAVLMASRHLARAARSAADYEHVYREVLSRAGAPVVLHWLGEAFDPSLAGYFGSRDVPTSIDTVIRIMSQSENVRGIKMSLLHAQHEMTVRSRLPEGTTMFTGDDFNYVGLIEGDGHRHSDALLGAFAALAPNASAAIQALDTGDLDSYRRFLEPTEALSRHVFAAPTFHYKTGVAFLSWLNGHQRAFTMVGGLHSARSLPHLSTLVRLADQAGALENPELAAQRWNDYLTLHGMDVPLALQQQVRNVTSMPQPHARLPASELLDEDASAELLNIARALFPHQGLGDGPYVRSVAALLAQTATNAILLHAISDGLRELRAAAEGELSTIEGESLRLLLAERETTTFFAAVRSVVAFTLYDDREVWDYVGYPGPSFEHGGYLERGFNDLAWLPEPRIEESDLPLNEVGPLRIAERNH